jgi:hypothetical protein
MPTENQKRQAFIPRNAMVIENPVGTAPAFIVEVPPLQAGDESGMRRVVIVSLPGVPREMETLLTNAVVPYLQKNFDLHEVLEIRTLHVSGLGEGMIDDQIGDLETLANPTVGLSAHSGVVDIRLAAKAGTKIEASRMIASIEQDLRTRLGDNIFGVDEDTLEVVALNLLVQRGWTLATVESGLDDALMTRLNRTGHPAFRGGSSRELQIDTLGESAELVAQEMNASVVLGLILSVSNGKQEIFIVIISPHGQGEKHLSYGGHPANARRWAVNMALDWLRHSLQEAG